MLRLAAHHEMNRKSAEMAVLERENLLAEHGARHGSVCIYERESTGGLARKHVSRQAQHGRYAAAGGKGHVSAPALRIGLCAESSRRRAHIERISGAQRAAELPRHASVRLDAHADLQGWPAGRRHQRIGPLLLPPADLAAHRKVLARMECECRRQILRHLQ